MKFEETHAMFLRSHLERRSGERRDRLERGHRHGEILFLKNVWWPMKGNFDGLHPEYEVLDWRGKPYFADFAYLSGGVRFLWEIKGFGSHVQEMDRRRYCSELNREAFLQAIGFRVASFPYDDVEARPDLCIALLRMLLSRYQAGQGPIERAIFAEQEVVRMAFSLARPIRPIDIVNHLGVNHRTALRLLQALCSKGWLRPVRRGKGERVLMYELLQGAWDYIG